MPQQRKKYTLGGLGATVSWDFATKTLSTIEAQVYASLQILATIDGERERFHAFEVSPFEMGKRLGVKPEVVERAIEGLSTRPFHIRQDEMKQAAEYRLITIYARLVKQVGRTPEIYLIGLPMTVFPADSDHQADESWIKTESVNDDA